jgi:hypothetical protein
VSTSEKCDIVIYYLHAKGHNCTQKCSFVCLRKPTTSLYLLCKPSVKTSCNQFARVYLKTRYPLSLNLRYRQRTLTLASAAKKYREAKESRYQYTVYTISYLRRSPTLAYVAETNKACLIFTNLST